jgi:ABC-type glycerol-3-phosphate transport system permease component
VVDRHLERSQHPLSVYRWLAGLRFTSRDAGIAFNQATAYFVLIVVSVILLGPMVWMVLTSLKAPGEEFSLVWFPDPVYWNNYVDIWTKRNFGVFFRNSLLTSILATLGSVVNASLVGFGFARLRFFGRNVLFYILLSTMMLPAIVTLIPTFILFQRVGWFNTFLPLIVPSWLGAGAYGGGAFYIFLMRQFYMTLPLDLDEAARVDGASSFQIYWHVLLPLTAPALATVAVFAFIGNWGDFLYPLIFLNSQELWTIALALRSWMVPGEHGTAWGSLMTGSVLMVLPVAVVLFVAQRQFVRGISMSGLTGR